MDLQSCIIKDYPTAHPHDGIHAVISTLQKEKYVVVIDEHNTFHGILTPEDLVAKPHSIVIDCVQKKEQISIDDSMYEIAQRFHTQESYALPVFSGETFHGVLSKPQMHEYLQKQIVELHAKSLISNKIKDAFLNNLSHEIRTPLNGMMGFLQILSKLDIHDYETKGRDYCNYVFQSAKRFVASMNDLIEFSILHAGDTIKIDTSCFGIEDFCMELHAKILNAEGIPSVALHYKNESSDFDIKTDRVRLQRVLFYTLEFAMKHCKEKAVTYGVQKENAHVQFYVEFESDLTTKQLKEEFSVYNTNVIHNELTEHYNGIGLPLAKKYAELLGGTVRVDFSNTPTRIIYDFDKIVNILV